MAMLDWDELRRLAAPAAALVAARATEIEVGRALIAVRPELDGQWLAALRLIWPCVRNPRARAHEAMDAARAATKAEIEDMPAPTAVSQSSQPGAAVPHGSQPEAGVLQVALGEESQRRYGLLQPVLAMRGSERRAAIERIAADEGVGPTSVYRWLNRVETHGAAGLRRRRRADAGKSALPQGARQMLLSRRLNPRTRDEQVTLSMRITREHFPGASEAALRHAARSIPAAAMMSKEAYAKRFYPTGEWIAPYPNHSWSFDYTIADVKCWDGDPRAKPYRPWVTGIVDECTGAPMAVLYTREHPDMRALRSVLLMAILPKGERWPQHGLPDRLHGDNGKIQRSAWLADACQQIGVRLDVELNLAFSNAYESWQNGHIESFWKDLHAMFEARFAEVGAYCGNSPEHKPEGYIGDSERRRVWERLPSAAGLNRGVRAWIEGEYLVREHSRLRMSRNDAWAAGAADHVNLPDEAWLRQILMFKATRKIGRARAQLNGFSYWHERLIDYDGLELPVWWDAAHPERVLVLDGQGCEICWAEVERPNEIGSHESLAEYRRKRAAAIARRRELVAMADRAGEHLPAPTIRGIIERLEAAAERADPVTVPTARTIQPREIEPMAADAGLEFLRQRAATVEAGAEDDGINADLLPIIAARGAGAEPGIAAPLGAQPLTLHGIDIGAGQVRLRPPASDPRAEAGPDDNLKINSPAAGPKAGADHEIGALLPPSFARWFHDRYGPHGDAPRQRGELRAAARRQLAENYAAAGAKPPTPRKRDGGTEGTTG